MSLQLLSNPVKHIRTLNLPLMGCRVSAGFPSAADDFIERSLDLNELLVKHPSSTFFAWAKGNSLKSLGIHDGDLLVIDRAAERTHGRVVVAAIDGELVCKILDLRRNCLLSAVDSNGNEAPPVSFEGREDLLIEGVVVYSVRQHVRA